MTATSQDLKRPALRYYGGKWALAPWIVSHFPHHTSYVEPFGGAASVLLRKQPAKFEIYNDVAEDVVNFFRVLRDREEELRRSLSLTPFSRLEFSLALEATDDPLERARRFYVRSWQGWSGSTQKPYDGWKLQPRDWHKQNTEIDRRWLNLDHLLPIADRLRRVQIECRPAGKVIAQCDSAETLFYVDPPYPHTTRSRRWRGIAYQHELSDDDHVHLLNQLLKVEGFVVLSCYESGFYSHTLEGAGWRKVSKSTNTLRGTACVEHLWLNPRIASILDCQEAA